MKPTEWVETATATAATATATKSASTVGARHVVSSVAASFSDATKSATLTITVTIGGTAESIVHYVHGADVVPLELRGDKDTAITAALATGGAGIVGKVIMTGHTTG